MGKKKRSHPDIEEILGRPWCYYCERDFDDQKVLINHQKAKHFKCERCGRRLNTAGGLAVHMSQVHKETLSAVDNALPNRAGLDIEIFGMEGIPEDIVQQHNQRVLTQYHQAEAERRVATGNMGGGGGVGAGSQPKKPKFESPAELKKRLADHKAKLAAEQQNGGTSGEGTPSGATAAQSPAAPGTSSQFPQQQQYSGPPGTPAFNFAAGYSQPTPGPTFQQQQGPLPGSPFHQQQPVPYAQQPAYSPPPFQQQGPFQNPHFSPLAMQSNTPPFPGPSPGGPMGIPPRGFPGGPPAPSFGFQNQPPARINTPPQAGMPLQRPASGIVPAIPGLPQRPAFGVPHVNHFQMQAMHQGQMHGPANPSPMPNASPANGFPPRQAHQISPPSANNETSLEDLISGASKMAEETAAAQSNHEASRSAPPPTEHVIPAAADTSVDDKKDKKDKAKATRLVYSDQQMSPEEKMARLPRYAFTPEKAR